jgi:hypothetical protein
MDQWKALVNTVMNFGFHKMLWSSWVAAQLAAFQDGLSSKSDWLNVRRSTNYAQSKVVQVATLLNMREVRGLNLGSDIGILIFLVTFPSLSMKIRNSNLK